MFTTIGQRLKMARDQRYLTLEKASEETRIRVVFLQALESDDYSVMPSAAQGRGFLRNYAEYLNINIDEVIAELQKNAPAPQEMSGPLPQVHLTETDVPSLTNPIEEQKSPPFWTSWIPRWRKTESTPEAAPAEFVQEQIPSAEVVEARAEEETPPVEAGQIEVGREAQPNLLARLASLLQIRFSKTGSESPPETEDVSGPITEVISGPQAPSESAGVIFAEIGKKLRKRRELISLTIEEVERHTKLRGALIRAMEEGAFDNLPSPVQTRGMLANYAAFLDLDADEVLLRFADALQTRHREKYAETPREKIQTEVVTSMPILRSFIAGDLIFGVIMIVLIFALAVWGIGRVLISQDEVAGQATAPSIVDVLAGTVQPTPSVDATFVAVNEAPFATNPFGLSTLEAPTLGANINVVISVFAVERTFMRIIVDGEVAFEGRIAPRETQVYEAEDQVEVLTGNAAALRISYNGRDLGLMGDVGEVVSRVYTIAGVVTPTSTVPPTPTETLPATITLTPSLTPTSTRTPQPAP